MQGGAGRITAPPLSFGPLIGRGDRCVYERQDGSIVTVRRPPKDWDRLLTKHLVGERRLALFPSMPDGRCWFGVLDLDAHNPTCPPRLAQAAALVDSLSRHGVVAYQETSRKGRGTHIWLLFDEPGVPTADLFAVLHELAAALESQGPVETFPSAARGLGRAIFLPYFGGQINMRDVDHAPVPLDKLEANDPALIPSTSSPSPPSWPPKYWRFQGFIQTGHAAAYQQVLEDGRAAGKVFFLHGQPQAHKGYRAKVAGGVARSIVLRGGTFEDFKAWDSKNVPPLATDEPQTLTGWWNWAVKQTRSSGDQSISGPHSA